MMRPSQKHFQQEDKTHVTRGKLLVRWETEAFGNCVEGQDEGPRRMDDSKDGRERCEMLTRQKTP